MVQIAVAALVDALCTGEDSAAPFRIIRNVLGRRHAVSLPEERRDTPADQLVKEAVDMAWARFLNQKRDESELETSSPPRDRMTTRAGDEAISEYFLAAGGTSIDVVRFIEGLVDTLEAMQVPHAQGAHRSLLVL
jgi:hypothetical protein